MGAEGGGGSGSGMGICMDWGGGSGTGRVRGWFRMFRSYYKFCPFEKFHGSQINVEARW